MASYLQTSSIGTPGSGVTNVQVPWAGGGADRIRTGDMLLTRQLLLPAELRRQKGAERETGFEPATAGLGSLYSTTELLARNGESLL